MSAHALTAWKAKRVGAALTIDGKDAAGFPVKVTNVAEIDGTSNPPTATGTIKGVGLVHVTLN